MRTLRKGVVTFADPPQAPESPPDVLGRVLLSLPEPMPHFTLAVEMGAGKSQLTRQMLLEHVDLTRWRVCVVVPEYGLGREWRDTLIEMARKLPKTRRPTVTLYKGIEYADEHGPICAAEGAVRELVDTVLKAQKSAEGGPTVQEAVCPKCPLRASGCAYHQQFSEDASPGIKIYCCQLPSR